jgi:hypothetical protein
VTARDLSTPDILKAIEAAQEVQKRNPPSSDAWQEASNVLTPLFAEMARREPWPGHLYGDGSMPRSLRSGRRV